MKDYLTFYQNITKSIRQKPSYIKGLYWCNKLITTFMYCLYPIMVLYWIFHYGKSWDLYIRILIPAIGFLGLSIMRQYLNKPRPYQVYPITPLVPHSAQGKSFPSRHVFSATLIAMTAFSVSGYLGITCLILSVVLGICRVVGGVHFPQDVIVSICLAILLGWTMYLVLFLLY